MIAAPYRRLAALLLLGLVLALPAGAGVEMIALYQANADEIDDMEARIARFEAVARFRPNLPALEKSGAEAVYAAWFLPGTDPAVAAAKLQANLKEIAGARGVEVTQARDLKPRTLANVTYVGTDLEMTASAEGLRDLLAAIESGTPLLVIDQAQIHGEMAGPDPRYDPVLLYVDLKVWGALAGAAPGDPKATVGP